MMDGTGIAALVLAAGVSRRLGRPKALEPFGGRPALARLLEALAAAGIDEGVVVVGESAAELAAAVDPAPLAWVENPDPAAGRTGSVRVGLARIADGRDVLLWPVDRPLGGAATVRALREAAREHPGAGSLVPVFAERRGHPILLRSALRPAIEVADPAASLRDVLRNALGAVGLVRLDVPVDDPGIHFDLDTEESVATARRWWDEERPPGP
jgi:CTP:molybdopterin cytidylyltransferase MocA